MSEQNTTSFMRGPGLYLGLLLGSVGVVLGLVMSGAVEGLAAVLLMILPAGFLVPLARSGQNWEASKGFTSQALWRYNYRMMAASMAYVAGLGVAVALSERYDPAPTITFFITLLPTIPTLAMVWVMGRYLVEETDEYLRHRTSMAALIGLGLVLSLGSFWGFLETFDLVPNIFAWWVVPVWAIGLAIGQIVMGRVERIREIDDEDDA